MLNRPKGQKRASKGKIMFQRVNSSTKVIGIQDLERINDDLQVIGKNINRV